MNGCEIIYKIIKYAYKNNTPEYIDNMNAKNLREMYQGLKYLYTKQIGGSQSTVMDKSFVLVARHGSMNTGEPLHIPENMKVILPFCCGMLHNLTRSTHDYFNKSPEEKIKLIDESHDVLTIDNRKYLILEPGSTYCNINTSMKLDIDMYEHISVDNEVTTKFHNADLLTMVLVPQLIDKYITLHGYMIRQYEYAMKDKINLPDNDVPSNPTNIMSKDFIKYIPYKYLYNYIYRKYHEKLFEKLLQINEEQDITTNKAGMKRFFQVRIDYIKAGKKIDATFIKNVMSGLIKNTTTNTLDIDHIKLYKDTLENINFKSGEVIKNLLDLIHSSVLDDDNDESEDYLYYNNDSLSFDMIEFEEDIEKQEQAFALIWSRIFMISRMSDIELDFIDEVVANPEMVNMTLQDHLDFIRRKIPDKQLYVFNRSCQGFNKKVCESYKCLQIMGKDFDRSLLIERETFSTEDFNKLRQTLQYIDDNKLYSTNLIEDELYDEFHRFICAFHSINIKNPILISKYFTTYIYLSYRPLFDYVVTQHTMTYFPINKWSAHIQFIKTILNLCITDIYHDVTSEHQIEIKKLIE